MVDPGFSDYVARVEETVAFLSEKLPFTPRTVIQLGTGLGNFAGRVKAELVLPYRDIPNFPESTVESHQGNLIIGHLNKEPVAVLQGRFHFYEGYSTRDVTFPIRTLSLLGAKLLVITNAAGGLNPIFAPGSIMVMRDHINFLGENPLRGPNNENWGPRFPDLSVPYHPGLIKLALDSASQCTIQNVVSGVYACIPGPSLETPAETRWLREAGGDGVGMSSVPEAIVALHAGMHVLGLSVISNVNDPDNFQPIILEDILKAAAEAGPRLENLLSEISSRLETEFWRSENN